MESKKINQLATELAPDLSDLTIIGDPTTGISKKITLSQMASLFTGTVEEYANFAAFPLVGVADTIYIALDTNILYRWNTGTSAYVELSPNIVSSLVFNDANGFDGTINLVGSVATLTITTALTTGSVGFIGASGALLQDNANFFWDDTNNRLGLGTNAPTTALDVFGSGIIGRINGTSTNNAYLGFASAGTNKWSIGNVQSDHRFRIYSEANSAELVSVLQTGEFGIGIANPTTKFHIDGAASALIANLDANVSVAKSISFRSDNSNRFNIEVSGTESGSNVGADLFIRRYSDAGALLSTPITITRSTGTIGITSTLVIGSDTSIDGSNGRIITNKIRLYNGTPASIYHDFTSAATTNRTISIPDISGTLALLEGTQTFSGAKTFSSILNIGTTASTVFGTLNIIQQSVASPSFVRGIELVHPNGTGGTGGYIGISITGQKQATIQVGDDNGSGNLLLQSQGGSVGIGISPTSPLETFVTRTSGGQVVALTLSDSITGAQTSGGYKAIRAASNNYNSRSEIRFIEEGGSNNDTAIGFATQSNASSLLEKMRINRGGELIVANKLISSTATTSTAVSTTYSGEKIFKLYFPLGTTTFDICTITSGYPNGSLLLEFVHMGQFNNSDQNAPSYKKALVTFRSGYLTIQDIVTQLTGGNIGTINFTYVSAGVMKINLTSINNGSQYMNGVGYVRIVCGNQSNSASVDPYGFTIS
jgi:hypothetical protein